VSLISVQRAYTELQNDGIIECHSGKGTFVASGVSKSSLKDALLHRVENEAQNAIQAAKENGVSLDELQELIKTLWSENN